MSKDITQLDELNEFLIDLANTKIGIRKKLMVLKRYLNSLKETNDE